jgi:hypothetical protein
MLMALFTKEFLEMCGIVDRLMIQFPPNCNPDFHGPGLAHLVDSGENTTVRRIYTSPYIDDTERTLAYQMYVESMYEWDMEGLGSDNQYLQRGE